jgi:transposase-like protein
MNELRNRGVQDILIAVIDGLKGFPEAITAVFPNTEIQTCIVHLIRNFLSFCNWKQRQPVARELKQIYEAETAELAAKQFLARISPVEACLGQRRQSPFSIGWPNKIRAMTGNASSDRGRKHSSDPPARNIRVV